MKFFFLFLGMAGIGVSGFSQMDAMTEKPDAPVSYNTRLPFYAKSGNHVIYHLYVGDTLVNYTGKKRKALAISEGGMP